MPYLIYHWFVNILARVFESDQLTIETDPDLRELLNDVKNDRSGTTRYQGIMVSFDAITMAVKFECTSEIMARGVIEMLEEHGQRKGSLVSICVPRRFLPEHQKEGANS